LKLHADAMADIRQQIPAPEKRNYRAWNVF